MPKRDTMGLMTFPLALILAAAPAVSAGPALDFLDTGIIQVDEATGLFLELKFLPTRMAEDAFGELSGGTPAQDKSAADPDQEAKAAARRAANAYLATRGEEFGLPPATVPGVKEVVLQRGLGGPTARVRYEPQRHLGILVEDSEIEVIVEMNAGKVVTSGGQWHRGIPSFGAVKIPMNMSRASLLGQSLTSHDFVGRPKRHQIPSVDKVSEKGELTIVPGKEGKLHLAWKFRVNLGLFSWDVWVNALEGGMVREIPLFRS